MTAEELAKIKNGFEQYCRGFRVEGNRLPPMLELKYDHSWRVAAEAKSLSCALAWPLVEQNAAEALGLLHDIGRFSQFAEYKTFADASSMDHGERGWIEAKKTEWISLLPSEDHEAVLTGIRYHNQRVIPEHLSGKSLRFLRLIRDADKLDIFHVVLGAVENNEFHEILRMFSNVTFERVPSAELLAEIQHHKTISFSKIKNLGDFLMMQLFWVHDLNYVPAFQRLHERGILRRILNQLDDDPRVRAIGAELDRVVLDNLKRKQMAGDKVAS